MTDPEILREYELADRRESDAEQDHIRTHGYILYQTVQFSHECYTLAPNLVARPICVICDKPATKALGA